MIDAHAHLMDFRVEYKPSIPVVNTGYDLKTSLRAIKQIDDKIWAVIGISPQKAMRPIELRELERIENISENAVGIGEIGLDYHWGKEEIERKYQKEWFLKQIEIAKDGDLPIVIHARDAIGDVLRLLKGFDGKVMFHFYSGGVEEAKEIIDRGWIISVPPLRSKKRKKVILNTPIEQLVVETDAPYVGKTCEDVVKSIEYIAEIKEMESKEVEGITERNTIKLFRL